MKRKYLTMSTRVCTSLIKWMMSRRRPDYHSQESVLRLERAEHADTRSGTAEIVLAETRDFRCSSLLPNARVAISYRTK